MRQLIAVNPSRIVSFFFFSNIIYIVLNYFKIKGNFEPSVLPDYIDDQSI